MWNRTQVHALSYCLRYCIYCYSVQEGPHSKPIITYLVPFSREYSKPIIRNIHEMDLYYAYGIEFEYKSTTEPVARGQHYTTVNSFALCKFGFGVNSKSKTDKNTLDKGFLWSCDDSLIFFTIIQLRIKYYKRKYSLLFDCF